jgi:hypothetical protein
MPQRNSKRQKKNNLPQQNINLKSHLEITVAKLFDYQLYVSGVCKGTREGWPLLTIETEGEWGLKEYK